jgi:hypothetical protein
VSFHRSDIDGDAGDRGRERGVFSRQAVSLQFRLNGVDIFFVISGYFIGGIVLHGSMTGWFDFANFYTRRARRILPAPILVGWRRALCFKLSENKSTAQSPAVRSPYEKIGTPIKNVSKSHATFL